MVLGTARKPLIVVLAVLFFGRVIRPTAWLGIAMAFGGVAWYNVARYYEQTVQPAEEGEELPLVAREGEGVERGAQVSAREDDSDSEV